MNVIDLEILIPASPDFIWRFLGDLSKAAEWHEGVASLSFLTTQNEGRGTRWRYTTVKGNDIVVEIGAWYDTLGYEYTVVDGAGFGENQGRIRLQEVSEGTMVRWTFNYEFAGVLGGLRNTMRLKSGITKQIQDSLRNLHKLVQQESGGISTHEARSTVREAPGVEERSSYQPRHPSALSDLLTANTESMPDPPILEPVTFDSEQEPDSLSILPEGATKPNPVVQTGNDIVEDSCLQLKSKKQLSRSNWKLSLTSQTSLKRWWKRRWTRPSNQPSRLHRSRSRISRQKKLPRYNAELWTRQRSVYSRSSACKSPAS